MQFAEEGHARTYLEALLSSHFKLYPEVRMRHMDGSALRIDYIAIPSVFAGFPAPMFGIEIKRGFEGFKGFTAALKQCIDYRHASIEDPRAKKFAGQTPKWIFLFPSYQDDYTRSMDQGVAADLDPDDLLTAAWRHGVQFAAERLAGKFNVGFIRESTCWAPPEQDPDPAASAPVGFGSRRVDCIQFSVSASRIWDSVRGTSRQGSAWRADRGRGSA